VTTSWDDGHPSDLRLALLLKKYGLQGTFYVSPLNRENSGRLAPDDLRIIAKDFEIGAHSLTHPPDLTRLPAAAAIDEIEKSKIHLESILDKPVKMFCYPHGKWNAELKRILRSFGFLGARTTVPFDFRAFRDPFEVGTSVLVYPERFPGRVIRGIRYPSGWVPLKGAVMRSWKIQAGRGFEFVRRHGGVFHLWGHSWHFDAYLLWDDLEDVLRLIANAPGTVYLSNGDLLLYRKSTSSGSSFLSVAGS